jgi:N-acetylmuramoyl-L-alanine amidase
MFPLPIPQLLIMMSTTHRFISLLLLLMLLMLQTDPIHAEARLPTKDSTSARSAVGRAFIVAIDAGHGGKDGGALGPNGTLEKDVVLSIAKKLATLIRNEKGMRSIMVRAGDHYLDLRKRAETAHEARADLFISLHADAYEDNLTQGSSVFTLSETGATSEAARYLADHENAAVVGGVDLNKQDAILASVLVDMSKNATLEASDKAAASLIAALEKEFKVHNHEIQKANFAVLRSLDVPSVLIETGFISNHEEEKRLLDPRQQERLALAIFRGIKSYSSEAVRSSGP